MIFVFVVLCVYWGVFFDVGLIFDVLEFCNCCYVIMDLFDDFVDVMDFLEQCVVVSLLFEWIVELILLRVGYWIGVGKWFF